MDKKMQKYYRILENSQSPKSNRKSDDSPEKTTEEIVRNNHYVYIDINCENGLCQLESIPAEDADQDTEKIVSNIYVSGVNKLPLESQKTLDYVYKLRELKKQKQKFKQLLRDQINATLSKRSQKQKKKQKAKPKKAQKKNATERGQQKSPDISYVPRQFKLLPRRPRNLSTVTNPQSILQPTSLEKKSSVIMYRGMQTKNLKQYLQQKQLQYINSQIIQKEKLLIAKYGMTNEFESATKMKSPIVRHKRKIYLPQIKSVSHFTQ